MAVTEHPPTVERYDSLLYLVICRDGPGSGTARAEKLDGICAMSRSTGSAMCWRGRCASQGRNR